MTQFANIELCRKLDSLECKSGSETFYCWMNDCVLHSLRADGYMYAYTPLDFIGPSDLANHNLKRLFGCGHVHITKEKMWWVYDIDQESEFGGKLCSHLLPRWKYYQHELIDQPDYTSFWRVIERAVDERLGEGKTA